MDNYERVESLEAQIQLYMACAERHRQAGDKVAAAICERYAVATATTQDRFMREEVAAGRM